jgi:hypothetical protein
VRATSYATVEGLSAALRSLGPEASKRLRDASQAIASDMADEARTRAAGVGGAYSLVGPTIRGTRDRVPALAVGGSRRIPGRSGDRQTVGDLLWGAEFGGQGRPTTQQFRPHLGTVGYAFWPAVRAESDDAMEAWSAALADALDAI